MMSKYVDIDLLLEENNEDYTDLVCDLALEHEQMVDNIKHMTWFRKLVTEALKQERQGA